MDERPGAESQSEALWREVLVHGPQGLLTHGPVGYRVARAVMRHLPSNARCQNCYVPFDGAAGRMVRVLGFGQSRKNPRMCDFCCDRMPPGGAEVDIAVLFADVRGSTALAQQAGPKAFAALMNRFYEVATNVLVAHNAVIDKMVGDEVMALFIPGYCGNEYRRLAALSAVELARAVGYLRRQEPWLPLGVAVHAGMAFVGTIGSQGVTDFTALGDTVNTAARLQAEAAAGEVILSEEVYETIAESYPELERRVLSLRGREGELAVRILHPAG